MISMGDLRRAQWSVTVATTDDTTGGWMMAYRCNDFKDGYGNCRVTRVDRRDNFNTDVVMTWRVDGEPCLDSADLLARLNAPVVPVQRETAA